MVPCLQNPHVSKHNFPSFQMFCWFVKRNGSGRELPSDLSKPQGSSRVDGGYLESSQNADENIKVQVNSAAT